MWYTVGMEHADPFPNPDPNVAIHTLPSMFVYFADSMFYPNVCLLSRFYIIFYMFAYFADSIIYPNMFAYLADSIVFPVCLLYLAGFIFYPTCLLTWPVLYSIQNVCLLGRFYIISSIFAYLANSIIYPKCLLAFLGIHKGSPKRQQTTPESNRDLPSGILAAAARRPWPCCPPMVAANTALSEIVRCLGNPPSPRPAPAKPWQ